MKDKQLSLCSFSVHDAILVTVVQSHQELVQINTIIRVSQSWNQLFGLYVVWHILVDKTWRFANAVFQNILQFDNIWTAIQCLQYFDFSKVPECSFSGEFFWLDQIVTSQETYQVEVGTPGEEMYR